MTATSIAPASVLRHDDTPSAWVIRFAPSIAASGAVLDVACGRGRHARWLEARGHRVTGVDRDADALASCGASEPILHDLEAGPASGDGWPLAGRRFAAVVVTNYLHRPLFPLLIDALLPGGVLLYETFGVGNERFGKPSNPAFLLERGELLARCEALTIVAFEDGIVDRPRPASIQRICAVRAPPTETAGSRHAL